MSIEWLTINVNPIKLNAEIIVKNSKGDFGYTGVSCALKYFSSNLYDVEIASDELDAQGFDLWSEI